LAREEEEIVEKPEAEAQEVRDVFKSYGLSAEECTTVVESLRRRPKDGVTFMMRFELGLEQPDAGRAWKSALTIAGAYIVCGIIPLSAYLILSNAQSALKLSVVVTLTALALFGGVKGKFTGVPVFAAPCRPHSLAVSPPPPHLALRA
jgi:VIT1/CCC1 family predicted Fe2+/Mn2+ transporter